MREIKLTKGYVALVDDADYERVSAFKWFAQVGKCTVYAARHAGGRYVYMHRFIMGVTDPKTHTDHRDGNGLNNSRSNLRACTAQQNMRNKRKITGTSSRYNGVSWDSRGYWVARIRANGKQPNLGYFASEEDAARAYDRAARELFGEFAHCNFALDTV